MSRSPDADIHRRILSQDRKAIVDLEDDVLEAQMESLRGELKNPESSPGFVKSRIGLRRRELKRRELKRRGTAA